MTRSSVPSVEPWSTTTVWWPATLSRDRSTYGSALYVTITAATSAMRQRAPRRRADRLPRRDGGARGCEPERGHEEEEARGGRRVGTDVQAGHEAHEERLPDGEAVDRERHEHDEEEQRAEHEVRPRREIDAQRLTAHPDRKDADDLDDDRQRKHGEDRADVVAIPVHALVERTGRTLDPEPPKEGRQPPEPSPEAAREDDEAADDGEDDEDPLDPEVDVDVVLADRKGEPDRCKQERRRAADRALEHHRAGDRAGVAGMAAGGLENARRVATDRRREHLARGVGDEVGARQPAQPFVDALRIEQPFPPKGHRPRRCQGDFLGGEEPPDARTTEDL